MSYDRDFGFVCDDCGESVGGAPLNFMESKDIMISDGWSIVCINGMWEHYCPKCKDVHE